MRGLKWTGLGFLNSGAGNNRRKILSRDVFGLIQVDWVDGIL